MENKRFWIDYDPTPAEKSECKNHIPAEWVAIVDDTTGGWYMLCHPTYAESIVALLNKH